MSDAIVGGLVTGVFALTVLVFSLRHATKQAERAEAERARIRRADRLRDSYRDYVAAAWALRGQAALLPIALIESQRGRRQFLEELTEKQHADMGKQHASLTLEEGADQAIINEFSLLNSEHMVFLAKYASEKDEEMSTDEYIERITSMDTRANNIARLARARLAELETPSPQTKGWWHL